MHTQRLSGRGAVFGTFIIIIIINNFFFTTASRFEEHMSRVTGLILRQIRQLVFVSVFKAGAPKKREQLWNFYSSQWVEQQLVRRGEKNKAAEFGKRAGRASKCH